MSHAWVVPLQGPSLVLSPEASARVSFPQEVFLGHPDRQHPHLSRLPPVTPSRVVVLLTALFLCLKLSFKTVSVTPSPRVHVPTRALWWTFVE